MKLVRCPALGASAQTPMTITRTHSTRRGLAVVVAVLSAATSGCRSGAAPDSQTPPLDTTTAAIGRTVPAIPAPKPTDAKPTELPGVHNVVAYADGFFSGSVPKGDAGFDSVAALGVKTIISVDGGMPEVAYAKARGIRYIHLPIGYVGIEPERRLELARATRDALKAGPVFVHCHHGLHRSAGAVGTAGVLIGLLTPEEGVARMKVSGTAAGYKGLYASTAGSAKLDASVLDALPGDFPEICRPDGILKAMVDVDFAMTNLKESEKARWKAPPSSPDVVPILEAKRLAELLRLSADFDTSKAQPADYRFNLRTNAALAEKLQEMLAAEAGEEAISAQFKNVAASCKECHMKYRD